MHNIGPQITSRLLIVGYPKSKVLHYFLHIMASGDGYSQQAAVLLLHWGTEIVCGFRLQHHICPVSLVGSHSPVFILVL